MVGAMGPEAGLLSSSASEGEKFIRSTVNPSRSIW